jgi:hypothetical protein
LIGCGHCRWRVEVWNGVHVDISFARASRVRFGNAHAITRRASRCNFKWRKDFLPAIAPKRPLGHWAFYKWPDDAMVPLICPTCQNVFRDR